MTEDKRIQNWGKEMDLETMIGLFRNVPEALYHKIKKAASQSRLKTLVDYSPGHALFEIDFPKKDTDATLSGRAFHSAVLEGESFEEIHHRLPEGYTLRSKNSKDRFADLEDEYGEGRVLKAPLFDNSLRLRDAVHAHPTAGPLLKSSTIETELTGLMEIPVSTGADTTSSPRRLIPVRAKIRVDGLDIPEGRFIDLKSTIDAREWAFGKQLGQFGTHRQVPMYVEGLSLLGVKPDEIPERVIIAVERDARGTPTFTGVKCYRLANDAVELGSSQIGEAIVLWAECLRSGEWPGYPDGIEEIDIASYHYNEVERYGR